MSSANRKKVRSDNYIMPSIDTKIIEAKVIAVLPEYHQTVAETKEGYRYTITRHASGIPWFDLKEGSMINLKVKTNLPMVVEVIDASA